MPRRSVCQPRVDRVVQRSAVLQAGDIGWVNSSLYLSGCIPRSPRTLFRVGRLPVSLEHTISEIKKYAVNPGSS
jgi:hypothetical protein